MVLSHAEMMKGRRIELAQVRAECEAAIPDEAERRLALIEARLDYLTITFAEAMGLEESLHDDQTDRAEHAEYIVVDTVIAGYEAALTRASGRPASTYGAFAEAELPTDFPADPKEA